jgi:DNA-binding protein YbaB
MSTKPIVSQSLFVNPNNNVMSMEQIFKNINKQMLETTYTLKIGQLLKITPNLKKNVAKIKAKET